MHWRSHWLAGGGCGRFQGYTRPGGISPSPALLNFFHSAYLRHAFECNFFPAKQKLTFVVHCVSLFLIHRVYQSAMYPRGASVHTYCSPYVCVFVIHFPHYKLNLHCYKVFPIFSSLVILAFRPLLPLLPRLPGFLPWRDSSIHSTHMHSIWSFVNVFGFEHWWSCSQSLLPSLSVSAVFIGRRRNSLFSYSQQHN